MTPALANGALVTLNRSGDPTITVPFDPIGSVLRYQGAELVRFPAGTLGGVAIASASPVTVALRSHGDPVIVGGALVTRVDGYAGTVPLAATAGDGMNVA